MLTGRIHQDRQGARCAATSHSCCVGLGNRSASAWSNAASVLACAVLPFGILRAAES